MLVQAASDAVRAASPRIDWVAWATVASAIGTIAAAIFAAYSALLARRAVDANTKAIELQARSISVQTFEKIFGDIRALDTPPDYKPAFFNTLEYLAFIVNYDIVDTTHVSLFFRDSIVYWYEQALNPADQHKFPEFTRLYLQIKADV